VRARLLKTRRVWIPLAAWILFLEWLFPWLMRRTPGGITSSLYTVWADWALHATYVTAFAKRPFSAWFDPHPLFVTAKLNYPFLANVPSVWLYRSGADIVTALLATSMVLVPVFVYLLFRFYRRAVGSGAGSAAVTVFILLGGMAFLPYVRDVLAGGAWVPDQQYSFDFANGFTVGSFLPHLFLPQRTLQLGLCLGLATLILLFETETPSRLRQAAAAVCFGLLPVAHIHSFLCVGVTIFFWLALDVSRVKRVPVFLAGGALLAGGCFVTYFYGRVSSEFIAWAPGWLAVDPEVHKPWLIFAWLNWGFFLPLVVLAAWHRRPFRDPVALAGLALFVAGNLFRFAPWAWDNTKVFVWAHLLLVPLVVGYLADWWRGGGWRRPVVAALFIGLTASGWVEIIRLSHPERTQYQMWSADAIDLAREFGARLAWSDVVLASPDPHHFVTGLCGAQVIMGFTGWLWSTQLDTGPLIRDEMEMYSGSEAGAQLLQRYQVHYVIVDALAVSEYHANEAVFRDRFPLVQDKAGYRIYDVTRRR
jgi:hypothetical protein